MEGQDSNLQPSSPRPYPGCGAQTGSENIQESGENAAPSSTDIWGLDLEARSSDAMTILFSGWFWAWLWGTGSLLGEHINKLQRPWWLNLKTRNWAWGTSQRPGGGCMQPMSSTSVLLRLLPLTLGHFPLGTKCLHLSPSSLVSALYSGLFQLLGCLSDRAIGFQGIKRPFSQWCAWSSIFSSVSSSGRK